MGWGVKKARLALEQYFESKDIFVPEYYTFRDEESGAVRHYELNFVQRFFLTFHEPGSCFVATILSNVVMGVIVVNIIVNIMMTLPQYRTETVTNCASPACDNDATLCPNTVICEPTTSQSLVTIDDWCVIIFTIEYLFRLFTVWSVPLRLANLVPKGWDDDEMFMAGHEEREPLSEPNQKWHSSTIGYFFQMKNIIDFVAILPFYISIIVSGSDASLSFIRALRLFRIVRAFNMNASAGVTNLIIKTVQESLEVILLLMFFSSMIIIIFGSIIVDAESGKYTISEEYPSGAYVRRGVDGNDERTPFVSTIMGMYWAVITMTTVGYGDIVPVSDVGRLLAVACAFVGVLFMALPISILGANFTVQYQRLSAQQRRDRKKRTTMMLAKKASLKTGKSINLGELELIDKKAEVDAVIEGDLKTGNRMADAIIIERAKDEEAMASIYGSSSKKSSGSTGSDPIGSPRSPTSAYDGVSTSDLDSIYADMSPSPVRTPKIDGNVGARSLEERNNLVEMIKLVKDMHNEGVKAAEEHEASDKRAHLVTIMDSVKSISRNLMQQAHEDVRRAEERARFMRIGISAMEKTAQAMLDAIPDPDDI